MNIYSQVLMTINQHYTPNQLLDMAEALTKLRCQEASKVVRGSSDGRLVRLLDDLVEALKRAKKALDKQSPMLFNRQAQEVMECENKLRKYCMNMGG